MEIEPGYYLNLFTVNLKKTNFEIMLIDRKNLHPIKELYNDIEKKEIKISLYADKEVVFGYGEDIDFLQNLDFHTKAISTDDSPALTCKLILDGVISTAMQIGYHKLYREKKGRLQLYNPENYVLTTNRSVKVLPTYDVRVIYLVDPIQNSLFFGLVVDCRYILRDINDKPLNFHQIVEKYGSSTVRDIRQIQKDLIPTGLNPETSRQRLLDEVIPFIKNFQEIKLPCDIDASVSYEPIRVILGDDEDVSLW